MKLHSHLFTGSIDIGLVDCKLQAAL